MEIVHILTVGTSLLENGGGSGRSQTQYPREVDRLNRECKTTKQLASIHRRPEDLINLRKLSVLGALNHLDGDTELSFRPPCRLDSPTDRFPQEVSYLWLHAREYGQNEPKADCYLLASDTTLGGFCAAVIRDYVNQQPDLRTRYHVVRDDPVPGVDALNAKAFEEDGFRNLLDKVDAIVQQYTSASRIYLNFTGGFKGLLPYGTLQGMLYASGQTLPARAILCYLFEETPKIIYMPAYPIGLNFHHWHRNATRLRMVLRGEESFRNNLSEEMRNLLTPGSKNLFSLGQYLEKEYEQQLSEDPLKVYSREIIHGLLPDNLGQKAQTLRGLLDDIVKQVGDLIWIGDKIPDMVDHALKHHQHLLEFAELFLTPILARDPGFMNSQERFCLLAGILLHDCGHSLDYFKSESMKTPDGREILLFPSEVRDYHHFLTRDRLNDPETAKELAWRGRQGFEDEGLDGDLHDAVCAVCLYHRRRTGYDQYASEEKRNEAKNHLAGEDLLPLLKCDLTKRLQTKGIDLMKVVAFMRLIDGCDVQSRRAGSPQFVEHKQKILERDYRTALRRAREAWTLYIDMDQEYQQSAEFQQLTGAIEEEGSGHLRLKKDPARQVRTSCLNLLNAANPHVKRLAQLWHIAAELVDRADMKFKQHEHYLKHRCVKEVLVFPSAIEPGKTQLAFDVVLYPDSDLIGKLDETVEMDGKQQTRRELIENEISSEYGSVREYAFAHYGLRVRYWWEDSYEARNASPTGKPFFSPL